MVSTRGKKINFKESDSDEEERLENSMGAPLRNHLPQDLTLLPNNSSCKITSEEGPNV